MALPEQIRKQTEAVQELYKQLNTDNSTSEADTTSPNDADLSEEDTAAPAPADENSVTDVASASTNEQKPDADQVSEETILHKYKTLQGMYNAEVPRLHQQNRELTQRIQQMEQLLASISTQSNAAETSQSQQVQQLVTEKDVEEYGESIDVMRKVSREELIPVVQRLANVEQALRQMQTSVVPQVQAVAQRQQFSAEQQFWADLATAVPNFREVNGDEAFRSWLLEPDPLTGITRQTYLEDAQRNLDAQRVANIFRAWLGATGQASIAQPTSYATAPASELEKQIAPGRSRSVGVSANSSKGKIYTPADIAKFFNDVRAGKYKGREQERDRIERDIFSAQRENRIQFTA